jgi:hypothetical protein
VNYSLLSTDDETNTTRKVLKIIVLKINRYEIRKEQSALRYQGGGVLRNTNN